MRIHTHTVFQLTENPREYILISDEAHEYEGPLALADRSIADTAGENSKTAGAAAGGYGSTASGIGGSLTPELEREAANPIGYTPQQQNAQLVAGEQGAGGSNSSIAGSAGLAAGRTRNSGALSGVLDAAARAKAQQLSTNALGVSNRSADLGIQRQDAAQGRLAGLYGTNVSANLGAMGIQNQDLNTQLAAGRQGWLQDTEGVIGTLGQAAMSGSKAGGFS